MPGTYELLRFAERIEQLSSELYGLLAARFQGQPDANELFQRLEGEEAQHASRIRLLAARYQHEPRLLARVSADGELLARLAADAEALVAHVRAGGWGDDLAVVKRNLVELEVTMCNAHAQFLSEDAHPEVRRFFVLLAEQDDAHARLLGG